MRALQLQLANVFLLAAILVLTGCAKNRGPATREYLKREHDIVGKFIAENGHPVPINPPPKPQPLPPHPSRADRLEFGRQLKTYPHQLISYYSAVITSLKAQSQGYSDLQVKMGSVNAADVEPEAVALIAEQEKVIGDSRIVLLNVADLFDARRGNLVRIGQSNPVDDILVPAITEFAKVPTATTFAFGAVKGFATMVGRDAAARQEIAEQLDRMKKSVDDAKRDSIEFTTERSQILASLSSKHSDLDWGFLQVVPDSQSHE